MPASREFLSQIASHKDSGEGFSKAQATNKCHFWKKGSRTHLEICLEYFLEVFKRFLSCIQGLA